MGGTCSSNRGRESRLGCEDNIKMDLRKIGCEGVNWIHLAQGCDR
jgi:hypothetical protein